MYRLFMYKEKVEKNLDEERFSILSSSMCAFEENEYTYVVISSSYIAIKLFIMQIEIPNINNLM